MANIYYARVDEFWRKEEKYAYLEEKQHIGNIDWQEIKPDAKHNWLVVSEASDFDGFIPIAFDPSTSEGIFTVISNGVQTNRDAWVYNFDAQTLTGNVKRIIETYNDEVHRWRENKRPGLTIDDFVSSKDSEIKWSSRLKERLTANALARFDSDSVRAALYRPFTSQSLYFDSTLVHRRGQFPHIFPETNTENLIVWLKIGSDWPMFAVATNRIADQLPQGGSQCFPFYTYNEDGTNRRENITDWALEQFRSHYKDRLVTKWDIFHYVYAVLHHPLYRERYAANLKRELPRIPFAPDFKSFVEIGKRLAEIHVNYEQQPEYPLERIEAPGKPLDWRVEKMKLSKDKRSIIYNDFLTLAGIPPEVFEYRLGNRSALEWIIDQYQVSTDKRSGITNDPNRAEDPEYIVRLIGQVITVSLETAKLVERLVGKPLLASGSSREALKAS
jgi:predicted helicase